MKIYNQITGAVIEIQNPNDLHPNGTGYTNWEQYVLDNQKNAIIKGNGNLLFTFGSIPNCDIKYRKITYSNDSNNKIGNYAQYSIGTVLEMDQAEKDTVDFVPPPFKDWHGLEQSLYPLPLFSKVLNSTGNGFAFLSKVFTDGKTTGASENALQMAINLVRSGMTIDFTTEEIAIINGKFELYNFETRIS